MRASAPVRYQILAAAIVAAAVVSYAVWTPRRIAADVEPFAIGRTTSADDMSRTAATARRRLSVNPADVEAAVGLADVLMRLARVDSDGAHAVEAEAVLGAALREAPDDYTALRMLGATYLAQHKFHDAVDAATRAIAVRADDAWNYGVLGDAHLELGEYDRAFAAFDTMARIRPDAASYARVAYAHELQGRLDEALDHMRRAAEAVSAHDPESLAWHHAQLAHLHVELGNLDAAHREYARADFMFPGHPYARAGLARLAAARRDYAQALAMYRRLFDRAPTPELAATMGDLMALTGDAGGAASMYARAESLERDGWKSEAPQPAALARMLAERGVKTADAVVLAEQAASGRSDIFTMDALALAYYRAGRFDEAAGAARRALRTGTRDRRLLYHAAAIAHARGRAEEARRLLALVLDGTPALDVAIVPGVEALARQLDLGSGIWDLNLRATAD
jgi:tetratricopeptide (TPR) repeat protein